MLTARVGHGKSINHNVVNYMRHMEVKVPTRPGHSFVEFGCSPRRLLG